jgi:hypothetical protein
MKFLSLLAAALLPTGILAAPAADGKLAAIEAETRAAVEARQSPNEPALAGLDKREVQVCEIVGGASKVNCRSGPNTSSSVVRTLTRGNTYAFSCVQSGECVVINGATNWLVFFFFFYHPRDVHYPP